MTNSFISEIKPPQSSTLITQTVRLLPTPEQEYWLHLQAKMDTVVWNLAVKWDKEHLESEGEYADYRELARRLRLESSDSPDLGRIEYHTRREPIQRYIAARTRFFKELKKAKAAGRKNKFGFPSYHSLRHRREKSFHIREDNGGFFTDNTYSIPGFHRKKLGRVAYTDVNTIDTTKPIKAARVVFDGKYWLLRTVIEVDITPEDSYSEIPVGVDVGLLNFAVTSDGKQFTPLTKNTQYQKLINRKKGLQRQVARRNRAYKKNQGGRGLPSKRYFKTKEKLRSVERHVEELKKTYRNEVALEILKNNPSSLGIENLNISGMLRNRYLAPSIHEVGWYAFLQTLTWQQTKKAGTTVVASTHFPSSKRCNLCGKRKTTLELSDRVYVCDYCDYSNDRDLNAALNLRDLAYSGIRQST